MHGAIVMLMALSGVGCQNKIGDSGDPPASVSPIVSPAVNPAASSTTPPPYPQFDFGGYGSPEPAEPTHWDVLRSTLCSFVLGRDPDVMTVAKSRRLRPATATTTTIRILDNPASPSRSLQDGRDRLEIRAVSSLLNNPVGHFVQPMGSVNAHARGLRPIPLTPLEGRRMNASLWLAAGLACAQFGASEIPAPRALVQDTRTPADSGPPPRPAVSKITDVIVYRGQALVTREVSVPEGEGTLELLVSPLPAQAQDSSLYTEGAEGLRVLSTRFRTTAVKDDTRQEVRGKEELIRKLQIDTKRLQKEIRVQKADLKYLENLGGFTGTALSGLTEKGRLDSEAIVALSKFIMENRSTKTNAEIELEHQLEANKATAEFATLQLSELSAGTARVERDAVIVVQKLRAQAGTVRLGYVVNAANWWPQYRLRGAAGDGPVRLDYLAAVVQQTGESWSGVRVTLSTARPSLDAAPPDLIPLKMDVPGGGYTGPIDAHDDRSQKILAELRKPVSMSFNEETPIEDVLKYVKQSTTGPAFPDGLPI